MAQLSTFAPGVLRILLLLLALCMVAVAGSATAASAQANNRQLLQLQGDAAAGAKKAAAFCSSPQIKKLRCGWATVEEQYATTTGCGFCGTFWGPRIEQSDLPFMLDADSGGGSWSVSTNIVSLACRPGTLVTRVVYKLVAAPPGGFNATVPYTGTGMRQAIPGSKQGSFVSPVRRCDLLLPSHDKKAASGQTSKSEVDAALRSKEVNCQGLRDFGQLKPGQWYSDTVTFDFSGCNGVTKPKAEYWRTYPILLRNKGKVLVAKFEVQEL